MITIKEITALVFALIFLAFSYSFFNPSLFGKGILFFIIILLFYTGGKKIAAYYLDSEEETKIWTFQRYGLYERSYFKYPIPIGLLLSFFIPLITAGMQLGFHLPWFAVTESDVKSTPARAVKRHQIYSFSEMTELHIGFISAVGIFSCFILSLIAYLINFPDLARLSIYFASFNLLPLGKLDGTRIFFGHRVLYAILVAIAIVALGYAFLLP